ncbi:MAG: 4Fe-4S dicluster domain-containing protein [Ruminococcaceae bacterium]|nr:4Fe-4S dicluster domain-containing protein [Oscillospiraceae bacterium]
MNSELFHSVTLDKDKCKGCIHCMRGCPTEAIRVRQGKAAINPNLCVDCGECIRKCPNHAKKAVTTSLDSIKNYKWSIALPAPSFYGQFNNLDDINYVLQGLIELGFDDVYEVSKAAEMISDLTRQLLSSGKLRTPVISSACPAVVRLIQVRFPHLCENVLPIIAPVELAAILARKKAMEEKGFKEDEIGIFFISPCPAKVTNAFSPIGFSYNVIDGAISATEVYKKIVNHMNKLQNPPSLISSGIVGISWAGSGGESAALLKEKYLAADGIENVTKVLEEVEDGRLDNLDFIELNACPGGCVGGVLNFENPFVARTRLNRLRKYLPISCNKLASDTDERYHWKKDLKYNSALKLSNDVSKALQIENQIEQFVECLPGLDCGCCGAPSCRAFAQDVITGIADEQDCVILYRNSLNLK